MRTIRLLTYLLALVSISLTCNARPATCYLVINGDTLEYSVMPVPNYKPSINIPQKSNAKYLNGIVMASPSEIASADVTFTDWVETPAYVIVLLSVGYKDRSHDSENYVITYKHERGIIDGAMVYRYNDMRYALAEYKFPDMEKFHFRPDTKNTGVTLDERSFVSIQSFSTSMRQGEKIEWREHGKLTMEYAINTKGMITRMGVRKLSKQSSSKDKDETTGKWKITEHNEFKTLGEGLKLVEAYSLPASSHDIFAKLDEALVEVRALKDDNEIMSNEENAKMVERLNISADEWVKNIVYRNPSIALEWMSKNYNSQMLQSFRECLKNDAELVACVKSEIKKLKLKKQRQWWNAQFNAWNL